MATQLAGHGAGARERGATIRRFTVVAMFALWVGTAACGGGHGDTYARGVDVQRQCCERVGGEARSTCLAKIERIDDAAVAGHAKNQQTYGCLVEHFVCDPATGGPTRASAQAQLDCIEDLQQ